MQNILLYEETTFENEIQLNN